MAKTLCGLPILHSNKLAKARKTRTSPGTLLENTLLDNTLSKNTLSKNILLKNTLSKNILSKNALSEMPENTL